ncbi:Transmembrane emp24 domain-containing protein 4 [Phytophthora nicotianae]|uniref:Transmembrane emp24 domain-containing protein 4 n=1 Tax=Phytophthora nicotianae TaxID=4792 RepID=A0A0W8CX54_PHYNI|nr:Transmembrane emp24 domain-containing protein 4 [Phytophthora nicotianae]
MFHQVCLWAAALSSMTLASGDTYYSGNSVLYTHEEFSSGNCNFMYDPGVGNYFAALNSDQWDSTLNCGRCAEVASDGASSITVYIVDECTECEDEGLGLSAWMALQPANTVTGVASMKIANQNASLMDSSFYFVLKGSNVNMSAVNVELTSISGETLTETLSLVAGNCTEGTSNFAASSSHQESEVNEYFDTLKSGDGGYTAGKVTPPDDSEQTVTRSEATSSGTNLLFVVPCW